VPQARPHIHHIDLLPDLRNAGGGLIAVGHLVHEHVQRLSQADA
jgi:hypothetical protein